MTNETASNSSPVDGAVPKDDFQRKPFPGGKVIGDPKSKFDYVVLFVVAVAFTLINGTAFSFLWSIFIVDAFGVPGLSVRNACGIMMMISMLFLHDLPRRYDGMEFRPAVAFMVSTNIAMLMGVFLSTLFIITVLP